MENEECCPRFDPNPWDGRTVGWKDKRFIKEKVFTLFFIPINFGSVMKRVMQMLDSQKVECVENMILADHTSRWNMDIYLAVDREVQGSENVTMSGRFLGKVFEGDFKETGRWCKEFEAYAKDKKVDVKKSYIWYTTCPKCAKKYGKNYVVMLGKVTEDEGTNASS